MDTVGKRLDVAVLDFVGSCPYFDNSFIGPWSFIVAFDNDCTPCFFWETLHFATCTGQFDVRKE